MTSLATILCWLNLLFFFFLFSVNITAVSVQLSSLRSWLIIQLWLTRDLSSVQHEHSSYDWWQLGTTIKLTIYFFRFIKNILISSCNSNLLCLVCPKYLIYCNRQFPKFIESNFKAICSVKRWLICGGFQIDFNVLKLPENWNHKLSAHC